MFYRVLVSISKELSPHRLLWICKQVVIFHDDGALFHSCFIQTITREAVLL
jgi:hypothetical protein